MGHGRGLNTYACACADGFVIVAFLDVSFLEFSVNLAANFLAHTYNLEKGFHTTGKLLYCGQWPRNTAIKILTSYAKIWKRAAR